MVHLKLLNGIIVFIFNTFLSNYFIDKNENTTRTKNKTIYENRSQ